MKNSYNLFERIHNSLIWRYQKLTFQRYLIKMLEKSQYWDQNKLESFQLEQMKKILFHSYSNVPYYNKLFKKISFNPLKLNSLDEVINIPLLDKETVRKNWRNLLATNIPKRLWQHHNTGGSTGSPLAFYHEKAKSGIAQQVFVRRNWSWMGYHHGDRMVQLRGYAIPSGKIFEYNKKQNILYLSSYLMNKQNMEKYISLIREFDPLYFHVYPSTIEILAKYMKAKNIIPFPKLKAIFSSSENIYPMQRAFIEKVLNARIFDLYGLAEHVALATECEMSNEYHLISEYAYNWLIDNNGKKVTKKGLSGEIVGTSFYNYVMPFVNYRTGDIATLSLKDSCDCGRRYQRFSSIDGRLQDIMILSDGTKTTLRGLFFAQHLSAYENIEKMQLIQEKKGELLVKIVKNSNYTYADEKELTSKIIDSVNMMIKLSFEYVSDIETTERGKHVFFINKCSMNKRS